MIDTFQILLSELHKSNGSRVFDETVLYHYSNIKSCDYYFYHLCIYVSLLSKNILLLVWVFWNYFNWETSMDLLFLIPLNFSLELWKYFMNFQKVFIQRLHPRCHGQFTIKSSCFNDFSFEIGSFIGAGDLVHQIFVISKKKI